MFLNTVSNHCVALMITLLWRVQEWNALNRTVLFIGNKQVKMCFLCFLKNFTELGAQILLLIANKTFLNILKTILEILEQSTMNLTYVHASVIYFGPSIFLERLENTV